MAAQAVGDIADPFFGMLGDHFALIVAGIAGPAAQTVRVAATAGIRIPVVHGEIVRTIIAGWAPGIGRMAGLAVRAKPPAVRVGMAGCAGRGRPAPSAGVAGFTIGAGMGAGEVETRTRVIESCRAPGAGGVAGLAIRAKLPTMSIIPAVAGYARVGGAFPGTGVAGFAGCTGVSTRKLESSPRMVKGRRHPALGRMTGQAVGAELAAMLVIIFVAGVTVPRRSPVHTLTLAVHLVMAVCAVHDGVFARQQECRAAMVKGGRSPASRGVAVCAGRTKVPSMHISFFMAGKTIRRGAFKRHAPSCHDRCMAVFTCHILVLAIQMESRQVMVEFSRPPGLCSMASLASLPETPLMGFVQYMAGITIRG